MKAHKHKPVLHTPGADTDSTASNQPRCAPSGVEVAQAAAGTLFMVSKLLVRYETDKGLDTQPMAELLNKAVIDWAFRHGASQSDLDRAKADLHAAARGPRASAVH
ncbi:hypothetical protein [Comamonas sp.]|uniref:hypothetical protein n=1 Tax=Comamonas sp. TaxID=34028 RepID=UPI0028B0DF33|nr:hypothetical protein [Comamonas sp.]